MPRRIPLLVVLAMSVSLLACGTDSDDGADAVRWHIVHEELEGALFSVSGTAEDDVWVAGSDQGDGLGPTALHWNGTAWTRHDTGLDAGDLLWVHAFDDGPVFFAGTGGRILRWTGSAFQVLATPEPRFVWGVWGTSPEDMWAVGGQAHSGKGFIWRNVSGQWKAVQPGGGMPSPPAWFKVWGSAADDVWFCGVGGAMMHWNGKVFEAVSSGTKRNLLTINGRSDGSLITAVGGAFTATLVASKDGGPWLDVTPAGDPPLQTFGVSHRGDVGWAVGMQAVVLRHDGATWQAQEHGLEVYEDLHGVWIDPSGGVWAAGGQVVAPPFRSGTLIYRGRSPPATSIGP